jgi:hypothetical protein
LISAVSAVSALIVGGPFSVDHASRESPRGVIPRISCHGATPLTDEENGHILEYFESPWIRWIELEWNVWQDANRLLVEHRADKFRPADAVHLASALRAKCDVLLTWDGPFSRINHSGIRIEMPRLDTGTLFERSS